SGKIFGERGQVAYTVTVLRDLTALRKVDQLKVERRMLEIEKFAATGRLAATIAHEVNNPMEAIKNAIYLLASAIPENASPVYNILKSETERVARIVRQMLGLYRNTEQVKPVNVNTIIEDTLLLLNRQLQRANVEVQTQLKVLPDAVIAADQIRQVLSNLVINARDAMPNGGKLRIRSRHIPGADDLHGWVRILIADTGTGIPPDMTRPLFTLCYHQGRKRNGPGTVDREGHHTEPCRQAFGQEPPGQGNGFQDRVAGRKIVSVGGKYRVLVVDDEAAVLLTYRLILEQQGYEVMACGTSVEAITAIEQQPFDVVLCDYSLEEQHTGFEVISAARMRDPGVPAALLTGYATKDTADEAASRGIAVMFK